MTIRGKEQLVRGGVLFVLADTLAAHALGGFKAGVGFALRKCRMCLATKEQISTKVLKLSVLIFLMLSLFFLFYSVQSQTICSKNTRVV